MSGWEFKFVFKDDRMSESMFGLISGMKEIAGYQTQRQETKTYTDFYFDTPDLSLESKGMVCRVRRDKNDKKQNLLFKRQDLGPNREVIYRQTQPKLIGNREMSRLLETGTLPGEIEAMIGLLSGCSQLQHQLTLRVERTMVNLGGRRPIASLNLDRIGALLPESDEVRTVDYEIELKSERPTFPAADIISDYLRNAFGLIPVTRSKFRRLARLPRQEKQESVRKIILDVDTGVDDALAILLAMNSVEVEVLGITVVGGNIDAEQSARNTAAVLCQLPASIRDRYNVLPTVIQGKETREHIKKDAAHVHGPDGLGGVCDKYLDKAKVTVKTDALDWFRE
ncbi:MAG: nucleoside hydrolase, partial [Deltaproteobacteria bacterium]|nr:nucleoside hydrolase [Deltaproteobacteria bacterium]